MIRVNDDYIIDIDEMNYVAKFDYHKTTTDKNGVEKPTYKTIGYYGSLASAISGIKKQMQMNAFEQEVMKLDKAIEKIDEIEKEFNRLIGKTNA